ncbi:hypothetical protein [uncultured Mucilaginibacter sp.]|uniref:hypothetical protein n=1 Tax=uncultured Mucilaginibacter sp. TaxID=797541 RepID=UPI0025E29647|nr:hypothetical protein [uncultured Mucilaginibacter sp.]
MKSLVIGCLVLSLFVLTCNLPPDCAKFRNGNFTVLGNKRISEIERNGDQQLEWDNGPKKWTEPDTFKVKWLNDHSYMLLPNSSYLKKYHIDKTDAAITVDILQTSVSSCTIRISTNLGSKTAEAEMFRSN